MEDYPLFTHLDFPAPILISHKDYGEYLLSSGKWKQSRLRRKMNKRK